MSLVRRLGNFFLLLGIALMLLFLASDLGQSPQYLLFIFGLLSIILGSYLRKKSPLPKAEDQYFRLFRKKK